MGNFENYKFDNRQMILETLVSSIFNHLTRLVQESLIEFSAVKASVYTSEFSVLISTLLPVRKCRDILFQAAENIW